MKFQNQTCSHGLTQISTYLHFIHMNLLILLIMLTLNVHKQVQKWGVYPWPSSIHAIN